MDVCRMEFSGKLLKRGFWLYVWDIKQDLRHHLYVGRTGDSSSAHASSPFRRIGQHLDAGMNAKSNALARHLNMAGLEPESCTFEMTAIGPIFEEQKTIPDHRPFRDKTAALERALADELKGRGYNVLGKHPRNGFVDQTLLAQLIEGLNASFPPRMGPRRMRPRFPLVELRGVGPSASEVMLSERERF